MKNDTLSLRLFRNGITTKILLAAFGIFFVIITAVVMASYSMSKRTFYTYGSTICLNTNAQMAYAIDGDQVARFARTLTVDKEYEDFAARLDELAHRVNVKYFYILVDLGVPGHYTYIYDATHAEEFPGEKYALGRNETTAEYEGAAEVLATGKGFTRAEYYNSKYGELYYAYAPIRDSAGNVVAFLGTDVDIVPLHKELDRFKAALLPLLAAAVAAFFLILGFIVRRILTAPLAHITESALALAVGELEQSPPGDLARRTDEIGGLARAFETVAASLSDLVRCLEHILDSVRVGRFAERVDPSPFKGTYHRIVTAMNEAMDVVGRHLDSTPEGIAFFGRDMTMQYGNATMSMVIQRHGLGNDGKKLLARLFDAPDDGIAVTGDVRDLFMRAGMPSLRVELSLAEERGGNIRHYTARMLRAVSEAGGNGRDFLCVMLLLTETTPLVEARLDAEAASRAKGDFLSHMSHEIRTPMNAIIGMTQVAAGTRDMQKMLHCIRQVENSSTHLLGIINDILDFSKLEAGKLVLDEHEFSITQTVDFVVSMMHSRAAASNVSIKLDMSVTRDWATGDSLRLNQVLINILSNAIKFSRHGGNIEMTVSEYALGDDKSAYSFAVRDYGIGMTREQAARLFQPFEQASSGTSRAYGGTGLGLAIARGIVQGMGGDIEVQSQEGKGSCFSFTVPLPSSLEPSHPQDAGEGAAHAAADFSVFAGRRALIVDDIAINREILLELLAESGLIMDEAENGREAVDKFASSPPGHYDVILMDMQMPLMDGCEATRKIRALDRPDARSVRIVAMTANVMREDVERVFAAGMDAHTSKPINLDSLFTAMQGDLPG